MKIKITLFTISAIFFAWILTGCNFVKSNKAASSAMDDIHEIIDDESWETGSSSNDNSVKAMEAYMALLRSGITFYSTENKKNYKLNKFTFDNGYEMDEPHEVHRYTFIQLYGDEVPTLVLELSAGGNGAFEVLRYQEGTVYGFNFGYRALLDLSADGTSYGSSGASAGSYQRLTIEKDICKEEILCYSESNRDGSVSYFIGDKKVTWSDYNSFSSSIGTKDVVWHDFTND